MNEQEKAAYILGLKKAIEQIEKEAVWVKTEWAGTEPSTRQPRPNAVAESLSYAIVLIQDEIAMMEGTRETKD